MMKKKESLIQKKFNRYEKLIEEIFLKNYKDGVSEVPFLREEFIATAEKLEIELPKNIGDIIYSFRFRTRLPDSIIKLAPKGMEWVIRFIGRGKYQFSLSQNSRIIPNPLLAQTKIPDATPDIIKRYSQNDEQALLTKLRYNRLIDIFTGITCYSLQNHLRTFIADIGQVETDELYVGLDKRGVHYFFRYKQRAAMTSWELYKWNKILLFAKKNFQLLFVFQLQLNLLTRN
ncbi:MAG: hypothetical protein LBC74_06305 [Planctomycetaceae bacterium]|nr:hypothetical protein [Planctomycetaceae bacterium]